MYAGVRAMALSVLALVMSAGAVTLSGPSVVPTIVVAEKADERVRGAAAELQRCLKQMTGAELPMVADSAGVVGPRILVGSSGETGRHVSDAELAQLGEEEALLRTFAKGVVLIGRTPLGTRHAVYVFLERLGCRWFFPGEAWEEIPKQQEIALSAMDVRQEPSFALRRIWYGWGARAHPRNGTDYADWNRRNRMIGALAGSMGHAYANIAEPDKHFADHPGWFPLIDGKRHAGGQLCLANREVQQRAVDYARNAFRARPDMDMISLSPNDGGGYCQCDACHAMGTVSDQTLIFANNVAAAIHDEFPGKLVSMYAYSGNSAPPTVDGHANVIIFIATSFIRGGYSVEELVDGWSAKVRQIGIRDYYDVIIWNRDMPRWQIDRMRKRIPYFHSRRVVGISSESSNNWAPQGLNYYVAAKLMWDAATDVDALLDDFYRTCWHAAEPAMRRYYGRWARGDRMTEQTLGLCFRDLAEAAELVRDDPVARRRVDLFRLYLLWVHLYQQHNRAGNAEDIQATARRAHHFAWRLGETSMIHTYGQFRERRIWRLPKSFPSDEIERWKVKDTPPPAPGQPELGLSLDALGNDVLTLEEPEVLKPKSFFTPDEVESLFGSVLSTMPACIEIEPQEFLTNLVPIDPTVCDVRTNAKEHRPAYRGRNRFVLYARQAGRVSLGVVTGVTRSATAAYTVTTFGSQTAVAEGELAPPGEHTLSFDAPQPGIYLLTLSCGGMASRVEFGDTPGCLVASRQQPAHIIGGARFLYFLVPEGTESLAFCLSSPDGHAAVTIRDPDGGDILSEKGNFATGGEFAVRIPHGAAGRVWSVSIGRCEDATGIHLIGVPPYLAQRPDLLLMPK